MCRPYGVWCLPWIQSYRPAAGYALSSPAGLLVRARQLECVDFTGRGMNLSAGRLYIATYQKQPVTDDASRESMPADGHRRHDRPGVGCWIERLDRAERGHHARILKFAARDVDPPIVRAHAQGTSGRGHACPRRAPFVLGRIVFLDDGDVRGDTDECRANTPPDHVNLPVDRAGSSVVARRRHRTPSAPSICRRVVLLNRP